MQGSGINPNTAIMITNSISEKYTNLKLTKRLALDKWPIDCSHSVRAEDRAYPDKLQTEKRRSNWYAQNNFLVTTCKSGGWTRRERWDLQDGAKSGMRKTMNDYS